MNTEDYPDRKEERTAVPETAPAPEPDAHRPLKGRRVPRSGLRPSVRARALARLARRWHTLDERQQRSRMLDLAAGYVWTTPDDEDGWLTVEDMMAAIEALTALRNRWAADHAALVEG